MSNENIRIGVSGSIDLNVSQPTPAPAPRPKTETMQEGVEVKVIAVNPAYSRGQRAKLSCIGEIEYRDAREDGTPTAGVYFTDTSDTFEFTLDELDLARPAVAPAPAAQAPCSAPANVTAQDTFTSTKQASSSFDSYPVIQIACVDRATGRRTMIADVRRMHGAALELGHKPHTAWVNGRLVQDSYTPAPNETVVWMEESGKRG